MYGTDLWLEFPGYTFQSGSLRQSIHYMQFTNINSLPNHYNLFFNEFTEELAHYDWSSPPNPNHERIGCL
jgi:hypothetical protein